MSGKIWISDMSLGLRDLDSTLQQRDIDASCGSNWATNGKGDELPFMTA